MNDRTVHITDVTLREYGQNLTTKHLELFTPALRSEIALSLVNAGFKTIEIFSCVNPRIAPSMAENELKNTLNILGKIDGADLITLVPNMAGFENFIRLGLGPDEYGHTMGFFFSAVESHNLANLGRSINETIDEYKSIAKKAASKNIRMVGCVSAAFGYRDPNARKIIRADINELVSYIDLLFDLGAETVALSDLQGVEDERGTKRLFQDVINKRKDTNTHLLGYHPHHLSDHQAVLNSRAAFEAGIRRFDASIGGTGGCITGAPGNQPTELLVQAFAESGMDADIDHSKLLNLSNKIKKELYNNIQLKNDSF